VLAPGVSEQDVRVALYHVRDACMAIVWYSFRLYQPQDHQALSIRHTEVRRGAGGAVPQPAQLHPVERLMHDHEGDVLVMLTLLVDFIGYNIGRLSHLDEINTSAHNLINQAYVELSKQVNDTEVATFVRTPRIFKQHLFFVMAVFLLLWTPFSMWLTLSWGVTVVFYPILIYLLAGAHACSVRLSAHIPSLQGLSSIAPSSERASTPTAAAVSWTTRRSGARASTRSATSLTRSIPCCATRFPSLPRRLPSSLLGRRASRRGPWNWRDRACLRPCIPA